MFIFMSTAVTCGTGRVLAGDPFRDFERQRAPQYQDELTALKPPSSSARSLDLDNAAPASPRADIAELWKRYFADRDISLRNEIAEHYLPWVNILAASLHQKRFPMVPVEELSSDGYIGLLGAIEGYNPNRGAKFETFAGFRVIGAMTDGMRERDWRTRRSRERDELIESHQTTFAVEHGRPPTTEELAKSLNISEKKCLALLQRARLAPRMEELVFPEDQNQNREPPPETSLVQQDAIELAMTGLSSRQTDLVNGHHVNEIPLNELAERVGVTQNGVYNLNLSAMRDMANLLAISEMLTGFPAVKDDEDLLDTLRVRCS